MNKVHKEDYEANTMKVENYQNVSYLTESHGAMSTRSGLIS